MASKSENLGLRQTQVQTYVSFTSFMTAVVVFFTGLLITQFKTYDISIKVPISFLTFSIFGFLYSTLIYTNAAEEISRKRIERAKKSILLGDVMSEYIGVYLLVLSIPLVISVITPDEFLRLITLLASLGGFALYQFSHFSMIERHFRDSYHLFSVVLIAMGIALFAAQSYGIYFVELSALFLLFIFGLTYFATKKKAA